MINDPPPNNNHLRSHRMGVLVSPPPRSNAGTLNINFNNSAIGVFIGPNPPSATYVQHVINQRYRNWGVNLTRLQELEDIPLGERALFNVNSDSDFISNSSNDTVYFSGSGSSSDSEVDHDNVMEARAEMETVRLSPGRRLGMGRDPYAEFAPSNFINSPSRSNFTQSRNLGAFGSGSRINPGPVNQVDRLA
uniref:Uncharacterized protein n=1 Tax=Chenopodium quinoa TaxID=63459 RepID=A0A803LR85_CHEQI